MDAAAKSGGSQTSRYNRLVAVFVALGSFTYGYCASIIGSTIGQPGWYTYFGLPQQGEPGYEGETTHQIATANGLFSAGGAAGALLVMWAADQYGRKRNVQLGSFFSVLGGALQGGAATLGQVVVVLPVARPLLGGKTNGFKLTRDGYTYLCSMFQAGRFLSGLGVGVLVTVCPMYLSEMAAPRRRGWLVGHHAIFLVLGYMGSAWVGYACYFATGRSPSLAWRLPLCLQVPGPAVLLAGSPWLPRSPRWLVSKGLDAEALDVIQKMRMSSSSCTEDDDDDHRRVAKEEFYQTKAQFELDAAKLAATGQSVWVAAWTKKSYRKRMIIGFLTQWGAEFAGPLIINNYSVLLYKNLGQTGHMPLLLAAVWLTTAGLVYNPLGAWLHDRVHSRRAMYLTGLTGCLVTTSLLAAVTAEFAGTTNRAGNAMGIFFMFAYLALQGTCCDTTMYLYVAEIFPTELRPVGMGFSLFGQFAASLVLLQTAPLGFAEVGWKYYLVIICWCIVYIPMVYFYWPETARLSLEEIGKNFGDEVAVHINDATDEEKHRLDRQLAGDQVDGSAVRCSKDGESAGSAADRVQVEPKPG